jgi:hypothetical protein
MAITLEPSSTVLHVTHNECDSIEWPPLTLPRHLLAAPLLFPTYDHTGETREYSSGLGHDRRRYRRSTEQMGFKTPSVPSWSQRLPDFRERVRYSRESNLGGICKDGPGV